MSSSATAPPPPPPPPPLPPPPALAKVQQTTTAADDNTAKATIVAAGAGINIITHKKHPVVLTAREIAELPNYQGAYTGRLPVSPDAAPPAAGGTADLSNNPNLTRHRLCVRNPRTRRHTLLFRYYPMFAGFTGPRPQRQQPLLEPDTAGCELEWVAVTPGTETFFCTPFTLFDFRCVRTVRACVRACVRAWCTMRAVMRVCAGFVNTVRSDSCMVAGCALPFSFLQSTPATTNQEPTNRRGVSNKRNNSQTSTHTPVNETHEHSTVNNQVQACVPPRRHVHPAHA